MRSMAAELAVTMTGTLLPELIGKANPDPKRTCLPAVDSPIRTDRNKM